MTGVVWPDVVRSDVVRVGGVGWWSMVGVRAVGMMLALSEKLGSSFMIAIVCNEREPCCVRVRASTTIAVSAPVDVNG